MNGERLLQERKRRGLSRKVVAEGTGLTEAKIANLEKGREFKAGEREALESFLGPIDDEALQPQPQPQTTEALEYHQLRVQTIESYNDVMRRLGGRPAPFAIPSHYRPDTAPPKDMKRIIDWAERVNRHLDTVKGFEERALQMLDVEQETMFIDVESQSRQAPETPATVPPSQTSITTTSGSVMDVPSPPPSTDSPSPPTEVATTSSGTPTDLSPVQTPVGVSALYENGSRRLSNSEIKTFKDCRRRWWLGWHRGLKLKKAPDTGPLLLGDRMHRALAAYYVPNGPGRDPVEAYEEEVRQDEGRIVENLRDVDASDATTKLADFSKEADLGRAMIEGYVEWLEETGADQGYRVIAPEQALYAQLDVGFGWTPVIIQGRLDVRLLREWDGVRLFLDHKTVQSFIQAVQTLRLDEQMKMYHVLEEENSSSDERVEGALYNMLRKVKRTQTAKPPFYDRAEVRHNPYEIDRFRQRLIGEAKDIQIADQELADGRDHHEVVYPSPTQDCSWKCEFFAVCPMFDDASRAEDFIAEHYVQVNPLARYNDEMKG